MVDAGVALQHAVERAVASGNRELEELDALISSLVKQFALPAGAHSAATSGAGLSPELAEIADGFERSLRTHLADQRRMLSTFNIAFFGRTGAGKSTLLSAFGGLDGGYVSPGESDWTTDVTEIAWNSCRLWDTPGINGWGRTQSRVDLEETARRAVEIADVVLLCFDSQSQQDSEFTKVSQWVRAYGKPAVAVLNVRNLRWRHPAKVASQSARQSLSRAVREHVDSIATELAKIDLPFAPIVAVQSRRALFGRASTPFKGPAGRNFLSDREQFGVEYLTHWSNFGVLEELLAASIVEGGAELRQTSLREGCRGVLDLTADRLERTIAGIEPRVAAAERQIDQLLDVLGYIDGDERAKYLGRDDGLDLLSALEDTRGQTFTATPEGTLDRHMSHLIKSHLSGLREASIVKSDELAATVFESGNSIDDELFSNTVFAMNDIQAAVVTVWNSKAAFLMRELKLASVDEAPDITESSTDSATLDGHAGRMKSNLARSMKIAGMAAGGAAGAIFVPAVANVWNPVGWAGAAVAVGLGGASQAGRYIGERVAASTEKQGALARFDFGRQSRSAVHRTYDRIEQELREHGRDLSWQAAEPVLSELMGEALALRKDRKDAAHLAARLRQASESLPLATDAKSVLERAQARVLADHSALPPGEGGASGADARGSVSGRKIWLGEDWFESGSLDKNAVETERLPVFVERDNVDLSNLKQALLKAWDLPGDSSVAELIREIEDATVLDGQIPGASHSQVAIKPAIVVLGDYSSGKSSLIKRLLVEMSGQVPANLRVRGGAATSAVERYDLGHIQLLDTPGFQSGNREHDALALKSAGEAALVLVVLHVNLLIGDMTLLQGIVEGTHETVAKGTRTIYLINRSDELGVDPTAAPEDFLLLKDRKKAELIAALGSCGIEVNANQVHVLSGDPFGEIGARTDVSREDYAQHRDWDGVEPLVRMLDSYSRKSGSAGVSGAQLDTAVNMLLQGRNRIEQKVAELRGEETARTSLEQSIRNCQQDSELLEKSLRQDAQRVVEPYANRYTAYAVGQDRGGVEDIPAALNGLWANSDLDSDIDQFMIKAHQEIETWFRTHASTIGREMDALAFTTVRHRAEDPESEFIGVDAGNIAAGAAKGGSAFVRAIANRDTVYAIGKGIGVKFKPWGAVKAAGRVAKVAPILAAAGVAADAHAMVKGELSTNAREEQRREAAGVIEEAAADLVHQLLNGMDENGPIPVLRVSAASLSEYAKLLESQRLVAADEERALMDTLSKVERLLSQVENLRECERSGE